LILKAVPHSATDLNPACERKQRGAGGAARTEPIGTKQESVALMLPCAPGTASSKTICGC